MPVVTAACGSSLLPLVYGQIDWQSSWEGIACHILAYSPREAPRRTHYGYNLIGA